MSEGHKLPDGVEVVVRLYLTSDDEGVDVVSAGTFRGGVKSLEDFPAEWREAASRLGLAVEPLDRIASDWRYMTRDEVMAYKEDHPE